MPAAWRSGGLAAVGLAAALAALYLALDPPSTDLAAALYRAGLVERTGRLVAWDNGWYGGHHLLGYSVLFGPAGALAGVRSTGALAIVAATAAFTGIAARWTRTPAAAMGATAWFAVAVAATVVSGRMAFALGLACATAAVLALAGGRTLAGALLGAATALASPVAALLVALVAAAVLAARPARAAPAAATGAAAIGGVLVLAALFPEGGTEPFVASSFWPALAATAIAAVLARREGTAVRAGIALYALGLVAAALVPTPLGGNAARLGALAAGPLAVALLWGRPRLLAVVALPLAYWTLYPAVRDWSQAAGDPSVHAGYYAPLLAELARRTAGAPPARVEIPFTARHWESALVAPRFPLARGWERQLDRGRDALFYDGTLTAARYRRWLGALAVRWVALPDAALDASGQAEARLVRGGLPYLRPAWRGRHWRLFEVRDATPLGATRVGVDDFTAPAGLVRIHWTRWWAVLSGRGCVERAAGDWTLVRPATRGALLRVGVDVAPGRTLAGSRRCR